LYGMQKAQVKMPFLPLGASVVVPRHGRPPKAERRPEPVQTVAYLKKPEHIRWAPFC